MLLIKASIMTNPYVYIADLYANLYFYKRNKRLL